MQSSLLLLPNSHPRWESTFLMSLGTKYLDMEKIKAQ